MGAPKEITFRVKQVKIDVWSQIEEVVYRTMIVRRRRSLKVAKTKTTVRITRKGMAAIHCVPQAPSTTESKSNPSVD